MEKIDELLKNSPSYELVKSAGFCFYIESNYYIQNITRPFQYLGIVQCTGDRPESGGIYRVNLGKGLLFDEELVESSEQHQIYKNANQEIISKIIVKMINECPNFYAIKAENEASMIDAIFEKKTCQTTMIRNRGRL